MDKQKSLETQSKSQIRHQLMKCRLSGRTLLKLSMDIISWSTKRSSEQNWSAAINLSQRSGSPVKKSSRVIEPILSCLMISLLEKLSSATERSSMAIILSEKTSIQRRHNLLPRVSVKWQIVAKLRTRDGMEYRGKAIIQLGFCSRVF